MLECRNVCAQMLCLRHEGSAAYLGMELFLRSLGGTSREEGECLGLPAFLHGANRTINTKAEAASGPKKEPAPGNVDARESSVFCISDRLTHHAAVSRGRDLEDGYRM